MAIRLTPVQRDMLLNAQDLPQKLGHALHRAAVRNGELSLRVDRESLEALILVGARLPSVDQNTERALTTLLAYLESRADRFEESGDENEP